jgi:hypothetical protein
MWVSPIARFWSTSAIQIQIQAVPLMTHRNSWIESSFIPCKSLSSRPVLLYILQWKLYFFIIKGIIVLFWRNLDPDPHSQLHWIRTRIKFYVGSVSAWKDRGSETMTVSVKKKDVIRRNVHLHFLKLSTRLAFMRPTMPARPDSDPWTWGVRY